MPEVTERGIRTKWQTHSSCEHPQTVDAGWGELRVGPVGALNWIVPCLVGEVGYIRGQALVWSSRLDLEEFFKKKK